MFVYKQTLYIFQEKWGIASLQFRRFLICHSIITIEIPDVILREPNNCILCLPYTSYLSGGIQQQTNKQPFTGITDVENQFQVMDDIKIVAYLS